VKRRREGQRLRGRGGQTGVLGFHEVDATSSSALEVKPRPRGADYPPTIATEAVDNPIFARFFDRFAARDRGRGEELLRRELLNGLSGRIVEVGPGNGINFPYYPASGVELIAVEPEAYLRGKARGAAARAPFEVSVLEGTAAGLPVDSRSADAVVVAGVLCSVPDQAASLSEFRRVLRAGGELRFYEHVRSSRRGFGRYQDGADAIWSRLMGGCHTNRDTLASIEAAGFRIECCRGFGFPARARVYPVAPRILGRARS